MKTNYLMSRYLIKTLVMACTVLSVVSVNANDEVTRTVPYSEESVAKGALLFARNCTTCHGNDGKARVDFVADATDLTDPERWRNGITEKDIYTSLTKGAGFDMPPYEYRLLNKDDSWHLINWIISRWTPEQRAIVLANK
jgi:mono/diheme cytochrome c family protein